MLLCKAKCWIDIQQPLFILTALVPKFLVLTTDILELLLCYVMCCYSSKHCLCPRKSVLVLHCCCCRWCPYEESSLSMPIQPCLLMLQMQEFQERQKKIADMEAQLQNHDQELAMQQEKLKQLHVNTPTSSTEP